MASRPTLPPQAYTRENLTAAFNWLQSQPESTRKLATTPDALVGLYMRAQRFGNSSLEADAPVSSQSFMSDLKHLAEGLKQFEGAPGNEFRASELHSDLQNDLRELREIRRSQISQSPAAAHSSQNTQSPQGSPSSMPPAGAYAHANSSAQYPNQAANQASSQMASQPPQTYQQPSTQQFQAPQFQAPPYQALQTSPPPTGGNLVSREVALAAMTAILNERSIAMIQDVKGQLNLSSDAEAVNMMISLAYKSLKNLIV